MSDNVAESISEMVSRGSGHVLIIGIDLPMLAVL